MSDYIRLGRRGFYLDLDCQSAYETRGLVQGSEDLLLMFRLTSWRDKEEICSEMKREKRMRPDQIGDLAFLEKGQAYIAETGRVVKKVQIRLPRTMYWRKEYGNFYKNVWDKFGGEWKNVEEISDNIELRCKNTYKSIKSEPGMQKTSAQGHQVDTSIKESIINNPEIRATEPMMNKTSQTQIDIPRQSEVTPPQPIRQKIKRSVL